MNHISDRNIDISFFDHLTSLNNWIFNHFTQEVKRHARVWTVHIFVVYLELKTDWKYLVLFGRYGRYSRGGKQRRLEILIESRIRPPGIVVLLWPFRPWTCRLSSDSESNIKSADKYHSCFLCLEYELTSQKTRENRKKTRNSAVFRHVVDLFRANRVADRKLSGQLGWRVGWRIYRNGSCFARMRNLFWFIHRLNHVDSPHHSKVTIVDMWWCKNRRGRLVRF